MKDHTPQMKAFLGKVREMTDMMDDGETSNGVLSDLAVIYSVGLIVEEIAALRDEVAAFRREFGIINSGAINEHVRAGVSF